MLAWEVDGVTEVWLALIIESPTHGGTSTWKIDDASASSLVLEVIQSVGPCFHPHPPHPPLVYWSPGLEERRRETRTRPQKAFAGFARSLCH